MYKIVLKMECTKFVMEQVTEFKFKIMMNFSKPWLKGNECEKEIIININEKTKLWQSELKK